MNARTFALIAGIIYLVIGVLGFIPGINQAPPAGAPELTLDAGYGYLLGLFPVNILHNIVHILIGAWGLASYRRLGAARGYARGLAIIYALLAVMGLIPGLRTTLGLVPIFGHDVWLHALTAAIAAYFGWAAPADEPMTSTVGARR